MIQAILRGGRIPQGAWPPRRGLGDPESDRVTHAMHASTITMAVIVAVAAALIGFWAPGRDGRQLRPARRIRKARARAASH